MRFTVCSYHNTNSFQEEVHQILSCLFIFHFILVISLLTSGSRSKSLVSQILSRVLCIFLGFLKFSFMAAHRQTSAWCKNIATLLFLSKRLKCTDGAGVIILAENAGWPRQKVQLGVFLQSYGAAKTKQWQNTENKPSGVFLLLFFHTIFLIGSSSFL